jgi:nucleoside-diphosphate-sugar epimerase
MRVFVAGATGVIGRALLPRLISNGHAVVALCRAPSGLLLADKLGAVAVRGDVLDAPAVLRLFQEHRPEAVVNLATKIPLKLRVDPADWIENDRVRLEGARNLAAASREIGARILVQESVGYVCAPHADRWITETSPLTDHPFMQATIAMEKAVLDAGTPWTVLRFGAIMAADAWHTQQSIAGLRKGLLPIVGDGSAYMSLVHVQDAAHAIVRALDNPEAASGEVFNVADMSPAPMNEIFSFAARAVGAGQPKHVPAFLAKALVGALTVDLLLASYRMSSEKAAGFLGYAPAYPTHREIWSQVTAESAPA